MNGVVGFSELYGEELEYRDMVLRILTDFVKKFGYKQIQVPVVEPISSFSEDIVGKSPWPEWNQRGCFYLTLDDYFSDYKNCKKEEVLLIPEGTVSVTRWLGNRIAEDNIDFPIKLFYNISCYRNELIDSLTVSKKREFTQFGLEIIGSRHIHSDVEIILLICKSLNELGVDNSTIRVRLNDIGIFNLLVAESGIAGDDVIVLKELLDTLAEAKAGKGRERYEPSKRDIIDILDKYSVKENIRDAWYAIINQADYAVDDVICKFDSKYTEMFCTLKEIKAAFVLLGINLVLDFCVIRSHEYYTSISFEVDVVAGDQSFIEIAGGGRYDKLVGNFVEQDCPIKQVPSTGFAFGVERVINMLKKLNMLQGGTICSEFRFNREQQMIYPENDSVDAYIRVFLENSRKSDVNIFIERF